MENGISEPSSNSHQDSLRSLQNIAIEKDLNQIHPIK